MWSLLSLEQLGGSAPRAQPFCGVQTFIASRNSGCLYSEKRVCKTEVEMRPVTAATSKSGDARAIQHTYCVLSVGLKTGDTNDGIFFVGELFDN